MDSIDECPFSLIGSPASFPRLEMGHKPSDHFLKMQELQLI